MKLPRFDLDLLMLIQEEYPITWDKSDKSLLVTGRPIPTRDSIKKKFPKKNESEITDSIDRLESYQLIHRLNIYNPDNIINIGVFPGQSIPLLSSGRNEFIHGFQITEHGKNFIEESSAPKVILNKTKAFLYDHSLTAIGVAVVSGIAAILALLWEHIKRLIGF
jgi:hypothetical protein